MFQFILYRIDNTVFFKVIKNDIPVSLESFENDSHIKVYTTRQGIGSDAIGLKATPDLRVYSYSHESNSAARAHVSRLLRAIHDFLVKKRVLK